MLGFYIFQICWGIFLVIMAFVADSNWVQILDSFLAGIMLFTGTISMVDAVTEKQEYKKLINTPTRIEEMIQDARTQEDKDKINTEIREYNKKIADRHTDLLGEDRNQKEEEIFNLQPLEEID